MKRDTELDEEEIDRIADRVVKEIEGASSKDISKATYARKILILTDLHYTTRLLDEVATAPSEERALIEKKAVIKALLLSTWIQRLYFIIRTLYMSIIGTVITVAYIMYFGKIGTFLGLVLGVITFVISMMITRLFDAHMARATQYIVQKLSKHKKLRDFIMNHF